MKISAWHTLVRQQNTILPSQLFQRDGNKGAYSTNHEHFCSPSVGVPTHELFLGRWSHILACELRNGSSEVVMGTGRWEFVFVNVGALIVGVFGVRV
ncbi:hypothetical protein Q9L58_004871 [Maublancomyces gigas]|uniref:Uncharacterized protein n=1 Tax=Discina gigas TaxID=1032678 RepID=A0ABR3GJY8_9PEZI